jgi:transcriptional regulator with XRE-family HTH domain
MISADKKDRLERRGWRLTTVREFLDLTPAEMAVIDARILLANAIRNQRKNRRLSQAELARLMGSNQSRVAKIENLDREVTVDLQLRAIFAANPGAAREFTALINKWGQLTPITNAIRGAARRPAKKARAANASLVAPRRRRSGGFSGRASRRAS